MSDGHFERVFTLIRCSTTSIIDMSDVTFKRGAAEVRLTRLMLLLVLLTLSACAFLPLPTFALFTEVFPYVKTAVAVDGTGAAYFTHANTNEIHAHILSTGVIITYTVNASLSRPSGLAADADGSLLIADTGNHRIVRLNTTTGELTVVYTTSGPALQWPSDVAVGADGGFLIADTWNHRIVRLSQHGELLFVYNTTSPSLHYPAGVSLDSAGRVFIADTGNNRIVQMSASGEVMAVYKTSAPSLSAPLGVVVNDDGSVLIADSGNDRVVKVSAAGMQLAEYRAGDPLLSYPSGVAMDARGALYVADSGNNRVVRMSPTVEVSEHTMQSPALSNPTGVAVDAAGNVLVVDWINRRLVKLSAANDIVAVQAPPLLAGSRVAVDESGAMYISDSVADVVVKLSATGSSLSSYSTTEPSLRSPQGLVLNAAGELFIADAGNNRVVRLDASGALLTVYNTSRPALKAPLDVAVDTGGCLYIVDSGNNRIVKLNATDGTQLAVHITTAPTLNRPTAVTLDAIGRLYIVDSGNNRVVKMSAEGDQLAVYTTNNSSMRSPTAIALDAFGNVLVCDRGNNRVVRFDVRGLLPVESYKPTFAQLTRPTAIALSADQVMYIVNEPNFVVKRSANGQVMTVFTAFGQSSAAPPELAGVTLDAAGEFVYATDFQYGTVVKLDTRTGEQVGLFSTTNPPLSKEAYGLTITSDGFLLIPDRNNGRIVKMNSTTGEQVASYRVNTMACSESLPVDVALDTNNDMLVAMYRCDCIVRLNASGAIVHEFYTDTVKAPWTVWVDPWSFIYVLDDYEYRVLKFDPAGVLVAEIDIDGQFEGYGIGMSLDPAGEVIYVFEFYNTLVLRFNASSGVQITAEHFGSTLLLAAPFDVVLDAAEQYYYVVNTGTGRVVKLDLMGRRVLEFAAEPEMRFPSTVALDADGSVLVADALGGHIVKFNASGEQVAVFNSSNPPMIQPWGVAVNGSGFVFVTTATRHDGVKFSVLTLSPTGDVVAEHNTRDPALNQPTVLRVDQDGTILVSDSTNNRVVRLSANGVQIDSFVNPWLLTPFGLTTDSSSNLFVTSMSFSRVLKLGKNGTLLYTYRTESPSLVAPRGLTLNAAGDLLVADSGNNRIVVFVNPLCPSGYYCPFRTPVLCPATFYCPYPQYSQSVAAPSILLCTAGHYCPNGTTDPLVCPARHFCRPGTIDPLPCPAGYHCPAGSDDPEAEHCRTGNSTASTGCGRICPLGSYCPAMSALPTSCPQFTYGDQLGLSNESCSGHCPAGTYSVSVIAVDAADRSSSNCSGLCTLGQYCPWEATQPLPCPGGSYCPSTTTLLSCSYGHYGNTTGLTVATCSGECDAGFICTANSITPTQLPCPPGQYNNRTGRGECDLCPAGTYSEPSANGTLSCTACPAGMHSSTPGASMCQYCPAGHYNNETELAECELCPPGTEAADAAEQRTGCTACPLGQYSTSGTCESCPRSTYSLLSGSTQCESCADIAGVECDGGIAYVDKLYHAAVVVVERQTAAAALNGSDSMSGTAFSSTGGLQVTLTTQRCPDGYCVGVNSSSFSNIVLAGYLSGDMGSATNSPLTFPLPSQCSDNRDQSPGTSLCGGCAPGYAPSDIGAPHSGCVRCDGTSYGKIAMLIFTSWCLVLLYYIASNGRLGLLGCFLYYMQTIAIMVSSQSSLTAWVRTFGFSPVSLMPAACYGTGMTPEMQYAMPLLIVPLQLVQLVVTVVVHAALVKYSQPAVYRLDELSMTYVRGGGGDREQEHGQQHHQEALLLDDGGSESEQQQQSRFKRHVLSILHHITSFVRYRLCPELTVSTVVRTVFLIVSASFTSVLVTCVSWFACTASVTMGATGRSGSVVYAFPAVSCHTSRWYQWAWLMGGCIALWGVAIVATAWWLMKRRRQLAALQRRALVTNELPAGSMHSFSALALSPEVASERVEGELRVPLMRHVPFTWYWPSHHAAMASSGWDEQVCVSGVDDVNMETRHDYAFRSLYGALYDSYRAEATGWIVVVWLRRLLLIVLSVALTTQPSAKYLSFLLLHLVLGCLQLYYQPFKTAELNETEQVSILVHMVIAGVLLGYPSPSNHSVESAVLTLTVTPLTVYFVYRQAQRFLLKTNRQTVKARVSSTDGLAATLLRSDELEL